MDKKSLEIIRSKVLEVVSNTEIDLIDKMELILNLYHFLDPEKYESNIKKLMKRL